MIGRWSVAYTARVRDEYEDRPEDLSALRRAMQAFVERTENRIRRQQAGVPTYFDNWALTLATLVQDLPGEGSWRAAVTAVAAPDDAALVCHGIERVLEAAARMARPRLVSWTERAAESGAGAADVDPVAFILSQGAPMPPTWRGLPLFKCVYDMALYPMLLDELRPATILELGSGAGASAMWLADQAAALGVQAHVVSIDLAPPSLRHPGVTFLRGDCANLAPALDAANLAQRHRPWLVIEDAHVAVPAVLRMLDGHLRSGDYLVVEDSATKLDDLADFMAPAGARYRLDTAYLDRFGRNATSAADAIFVCVDS